MWLLLVPAREKSITPSFISEGRGAHDFIQPGERRIKKNSPLMWSSLIVMQEQEGKRHLNGGSCYPEHMGIVCQWVQRSHLCGDQWGLEGSRSMSNQMYRFTQVYLDTCWDCRDSCLKSTETILLSCSVKCLFHNKTDNPNHQTFYQIFWTLQYVFFFFWGGVLLDNLSVTFPAGSPLNEQNRWLLQLLRPAAHPLQLADIPVGHPVAPAHRLGGFARANPTLASPPHRHGVAHPAGDGALQPLCARRVPELPAAAARFALAGRAHQAAVAGVEGLSRLAVRW